MNQNQYLPEKVLIPFFGIKKPIVGVEIGVLGGVGSMIMLGKMPNLKLYCIDPWKHFKGHGFEAEHDQSCHDINYETTKNRLKAFGERAIILRMTSDEAMNYVKEKVDFVHIDGDHRYEQVKKDVRNWKIKLKPISILSGHDWNNDDIKKAVKEEVKGKIQTGEDLVWYKINGQKT